MPGTRETNFPEKIEKEIDTCEKIFYILQNVKYLSTAQRGVIACGFAEVELQKSEKMVIDPNRRSIVLGRVAKCFTSNVLCFAALPADVLDRL